MKNSLTEIELYVIQRVKQLRENRGLTQMSLSLLLGKGVGFIGDIEAPSKNAKYNIRHLNEIAKILECSPRDFLPEQPL